MLTTVKAKATMDGENGERSFNAYNLPFFVFLEIYKKISYLFSPELSKKSSHSSEMIETADKRQNRHVNPEYD